ncbi:MAG: acyl-ACP--UDP-N-acetylglucosamine O-acyltransferase [Acidobacteria bacterium]|nr:acyl-ACP--UDP-N-acetylglucosamine O-acyltransferase [Acidobacteriota bacterium]
MATEIHPTAVIGEHAQIGDGVRIGPYAIVEDYAMIGDGTRIGAHATIHSYTRLGKDNQVFNYADVGGLPQDLKFDGSETWLDIGDSNVIREFATIHRSNNPREKTLVGHQNFIMAYAHIAHNCVIGNHTIIVNYAGLSGHVEVEDRAFVSGGTLVHQFVKIGRLAMVGGASRITQDILPYTMVAGNPAGFYGLNLVGLRRNQLGPTVRNAIKRAISTIRAGGSKDTILDRLAAREESALPEVQYIMDFVRRSNRGLLIRPATDKE